MEADAEGDGGSTTVLPKFSNPLIELSATTWIQRFYIGIYTRRRSSGAPCSGSLLHPRVKPRLCGATRRQATGDYNGISSRLAYELRSPSSAASLRRPRTLVPFFNVSRSNALPPRCIPFPPPAPDFFLTVSMCLSHSRVLSLSPLFTRARATHSSFISVRSLRKSSARLRLQTEDYSEGLRE